MSSSEQKRQKLNSLEFQVTPVKEITPELVFITIKSALNVTADTFNPSRTEITQHEEKRRPLRIHFGNKFFKKMRKWPKKL